MSHKTKQAALKAARETLGAEAIEGVDFNLRNTGAGWSFEEIPAANEAADKAKAEKKAETETLERPKTAPAGSGKKPPRKPEAPPAAPERRRAKAAKPHAPGGRTKSEMIIAKLHEPGGATSKELEEMTGWAPHSVRGFLGGLRKNGVTVVSKKLKGEPTIYRIPSRSTATAPETVGDII